MRNTSTWNLVLSIVAILVTLLSVINEEYRILLISIFSLFIAAYFLYEIYGKLEENSREIRKLNEKLKIHRDLIGLKADIKQLKWKVFKK
ncbi:MAG: hypothetical protein KKG75_00130 [Nanoarchaeota archaeon]|nr:hypothetical protein [Nanoarchaeota archaeon]